MLTVNGDKILDALTNYVLNQGFSSKMRELRSDFYSKADFKIASKEFATHTEIK